MHAWKIDSKLKIKSLRGGSSLKEGEDPWQWWFLIFVFISRDNNPIKN
jgi:hypothetical protein